MPTPPNADFCIEIGFSKGSKDPSRIFKAMTGLIEAFEIVDKKLVRSIDVKIEPVLMLEDVEAGSLRTWLRSILTATDDDALKNLDWKPQVGKYLVKAKYYLIDFLGRNTAITSRDQITLLGQKLLAAATETDVRHIPTYSAMPASETVESLRLLSAPVAGLQEGDSAKYITAEDESSFNLSFHFAPEAIEDLLTKETIEQPQRMILMVKKPDYLGDSMWEFRFENRSIEVKIIDRDWLARFQRREVDVRPGDALRANVNVTAKYGYEGEVVGIHYAVSRVEEVIKPIGAEQNGLFDADVPHQADSNSPNSQT